MAKQGRRRATSATAAAISLAAVGLLFAACGGKSQAAVADVRPAAARVTTTTTTTVPPETTTIVEPATTVPPVVERSEVVIVRDLLDRFDQTSTALGARPQEAVDPASAARMAFDLAVMTGSDQSTHTLDTFVLRAISEGKHLVPAADGFSFHTHAVDVQPAQDQTIDFTWCSYSPGVWIDDASGEVVDNLVAHEVGSATAREQPAGWLIDDITHSEHINLPAGSPDPCI